MTTLTPATMSDDELSGLLATLGEELTLRHPISAQAATEASKRLKTRLDLYQAREEFLNVIADGSITLEHDGDETGDCSKFIITTGWSQLRDLIDALGLPELKTYLRGESNLVLDRITKAIETPAEPPKPQPEEKLADYGATPTKCEGCSEPATLCETCAIDRAQP